VWLVVPRKGSDAGVDATQLARVAVGPGGAAAECVLAAALEPAPGGATLLAAVGTTATPRFERLHVSADGSGSSIVTHLQPAGAAAAIVRPSVGNADTGRSTARGVIPPAVLGPDNAGEPVLQRLPAGAARKRLAPEPDAAMTLAAAAGGGTPGVPADCVMSEEEEELGSGASTEPTLGQRLADLEQQAADTAAAAAADEVVAAATQQQQELLAPSQQQQLKQQQQRVLGSGGVAGTASLPPGPLKADSLSVLLTQALRSSDRALLEQCLAVGNERVIANTVRRLLPLDAALLLRAAVERLQSRPSRGQQLAAWIQAVLLHHTAYLMAAPGAAPVMSALYQTIEARLAVQRQLLGLTGRLELLLAQGGGGSGAGEPGGAVAAPGTALEYEETDSEAEVEVVDALQDALDGDSDGEYTDEEEEDEEDEGSEDEGGGTSEDG
jgi:U3 small nucleolar RNA-associated protein 5